MTYNTIARRAIVVGSGMAGLFAARILSDHFDEVVLIDRDEVPDSPRTRDGVPQGKHFHALLPGGLNIASELFPGFPDDLHAAGAMPCVVGQDSLRTGPRASHTPSRCTNLSRSQGGLSISCRVVCSSIACGGASKVSLTWRRATAR